MRKICVIGGGPAGIMAAFTAAGREGNHAVLLEKNEKLGKKLYITGKGRCNFTNSAEMGDFFINVLRNPKFLYSAFNAFTNEDLMRFFEEHGLKVNKERGGRVFPASGKSSDVIKACLRALNERNAEIRLNTRADGLLCENGRIKGAVVNGLHEEYDSVILATGGLSYPLTGSTGDGYKFAKSLGHSVTNLYPSLVPVETKGDIAGRIKGLSLKNVSVTLFQKNKAVYKGMGEMLFTHFGVSGPLILSASAMTDMNNIDGSQIIIDFKPALDETALDKRILRDFKKYINKDISNAMSELLPKRLIPVILDVCFIDPRKKTNEITAEERKKLLRSIKAFKLEIKTLGSLDEAVITRGGIDTKEINAGTMQSKLIHGLYFAGEIIDTDALTGGFNMQIAFSTGYLAGLNA